MAESKVKLVLSFLNKNMSEARWYGSTDMASRIMEVGISYNYAYSILASLSNTDSMNKNDTGDGVKFARIKRLTHSAYLKGMPKYTAKKKEEVKITQDLCDQIKIMSEADIPNNNICKAFSIRPNTLTRIETCDFDVDKYINYKEPSKVPLLSFSKLGEPDLEEGPMSELQYDKIILHNVNWLCKKIQEMDKQIKGLKGLYNIKDRSKASE